MLIEQQNGLRSRRKAKADHLRLFRKAFQESAIPRSTVYRLGREMGERDYGSPIKPTPECLEDYYPLQEKNGILYASSGDHESWSRCWLLPGVWTTDDVVIELGCYPRYNGPGRGFANAPHIEWNNHSTIVTQRGGMDI